MKMDTGLLRRIIVCDDETWTTTKLSENLLWRFAMKILRKILGPINKTGE